MSHFLGRWRGDGIAEDELVGEGSTALLARRAAPPMVGRQDELDQIERLMDDAAGGRGSVLLLTREPGIGKSRLVE